MHTNWFRLLACSGFLAFFIITLAAPSAWPQSVADRVRLVERAIGIPGHPAPRPGWHDGHRQGHRGRDRVVPS